MSKAVLLSVQPKWCELIASGKKTVEVRKTRPKLETPFKVYIYQTKKTWVYNIFSKIPDGQGKVIGEFVCDKFDEFTPTEKGVMFKKFSALYEACLSVEEIKAYLGGKIGYGWHISELVIYDKPKELSEFTHACLDNIKACKMCRHTIDGMKCKPITRPPQSWCYVEELNE